MEDSVLAASEALSIPQAPEGPGIALGAAVGVGDWHHQDCSALWAGQEAALEGA